MSSKRLFGTNGIRGVVNTELTPEMTVNLGAAIGTFFEKKKIVLGYDARTSGPMFAMCVSAGLMATGCEVFSSGMAPTPALQYSVKNHKMDGAVIITASHNPPEYNGIKVIWKDGIEISREQEIEIERMFFEEKHVLARWDEIGTEHNLPDIIDEYVAAIKKKIDVQGIAQKNFHVVVDVANSVGGLAAPFLLRELGCKVTSINANIDGTFPGRMPEPRPENLTDLSSVVKAIGADLGVAFDGDADRAIFVDENGKVCWGDKTFALIEKDFLMRNPHEKIVTPVSSSALIKDIADAFEGEVIWTKVGSVTVSQTMKKLKAKLGGEENGGVFFGPHQSVRDGAMTMALILGIMAHTDKKISQLIGEMPEYFIEKRKIQCPHEKKKKLLIEIQKEMEGLNMSKIDGVKIWFQDRSSILIRPSGTEPIYRLYAEAKNPERASKLIDEYLIKLENLIKVV